MTLGLGLGLPTALTAARGSAPAPAAGVTWDAATKGASTTLSNGSLTATAETSAQDCLLSTTSHNSGKRVIRFVPLFTGADSSEEILVGAADVDNALSEGVVFGILAADGSINTGTGPTGPLAAYVFASGENVDLFLNFDTGRGWFITPATVGLTDPEAGTDWSIEFPPNTALFLIAYVQSLDDNASGSVTIDPTFTSGTFAAWNA